MTTPALRIGARGSPLSRAQTEWFASQLPCCPILVWVKSEGDKDRVTDLKAFGGVGVFTRELHRALFDDRIDAAVHSLKDLPAGEEPGVLLGCVPVREDVRDAIVSRGDTAFADLPEGARVGTGSPRRAAQLLRARPDLRIEAIRGNVDTRLAHVHDGRLDAVVLALAGLKRLGREDVVSDVLDPEVCLPAAAQGALGVTIRAGDADAEEAVASLRDVKSAACVAAERAALHALGAGCHAPVGSLAEIEEGQVRLRVRVVSLDGTETLEHVDDAPLVEAAELGRRVATALLAAGAGRIVEAS